MRRTHCGIVLIVIFNFMQSNPHVWRVRRHRLSSGSGNVMCVSVGGGRRSVRTIIGTVTRPRWQHCSSAFCAVPYRPSLDESFFPYLAAV